MYAIIGLGNVGVTYEKTYHNVGFMAIDSFAEKHGIKFTKKKYNALFGEGMIDGKKVILLKPTTFMNNSGLSVSEVVKKLKLDLKKVLVIYDDIDVAVGEIRLREKGSAGTHNGMRSIIAHLGTGEFPRVRIGIKSTYFNLADYVLSQIKPEHKDGIIASIEKSVHAIEEFIKHDGDINRIH